MERELTVCQNVIIAHNFHFSSYSVEIWKEIHDILLNKFRYQIALMSWDYWDPNFCNKANFVNKREFIRA
jgi:hypothetical protein